MNPAPRCSSPESGSSRHLDFTALAANLTAAELEIQWITPDFLMELA
ncbi:MAG TPA: hypothetical protein VF772_04905 [Terriglobales bacterium]